MNQINNIQRILNKDKSEADNNISHFTIEEKCSAIANWYQCSEIKFDMSFVNSVHDHFIRFGKCSEKQIYAVDKIINKFKIDVDRWVL